MRQFPFARDDHRLRAIFNKLLVSALARTPEQTSIGFSKDEHACIAACRTILTRGPTVHESQSPFIGAVALAVETAVSPNQLKQRQNRCIVMLDRR